MISFFFSPQAQIKLCESTDIYNTSTKCMFAFDVFKDLTLDMTAACQRRDEKPWFDGTNQILIGDLDMYLEAFDHFKLTTDVQRIKSKARDIILANFRAMLKGANEAGTEFPEPFDLCLTGYGAFVPHYCRTVGS